MPDDLRGPTSRIRGHPIYLDGVEWRFTDDDTVVGETSERPCVSCGESCTPEGYDACLGELPGVANACCGQGDVGFAYIHYIDGSELHGAEAIAEFNRMREPGGRPPTDTGASSE